MRYGFRFLMLLLAAGCGPLKTHPPVVTSDVVVDTPAIDVAPSDVRDVSTTDTADAAPSDVTDASPSDITDAASDSADAAADASDVTATDATDATDVSTIDVALDAATDAAILDVPMHDRPVLDAVPSDTFSDGPSGEWVPIAGGACNARERNVATQESPHVDPDAGAIVYLTNPPASGPHYPIWAHWGAWPNLPRGYWVHNLEHGGVALLYNCPAGACEATRDALIAASRTIPMDPACVPTDAEPATVRVVITNDSEITTPIAGAAWGWLYAADCVDAASIRSFYARHAGMATENFCSDGFYP